MHNFKLCQSGVNQIIQLNLFFISTGATWYYNAIYKAFSYFELFTDYEDDILKVISNLHIQLKMWGSKFDWNIYNFWGKSLKVDLVVEYGMTEIFLQNITYCDKINTN